MIDQWSDYVDRCQRKNNDLASEIMLQYITIYIASWLLLVVIIIVNHDITYLYNMITRSLIYFLINKIYYIFSHLTYINSAITAL